MYILAFCGKSASGKDSHSKWVKKLIEREGYSVKRIVAYTSRIPRVREKNGIDYNFVSISEFIDKEEEFAEKTSFLNGQLYYGTKSADYDCKINIGIYNPEGLKQLALSLGKQDYEIIPIYFDIPFRERISRSIKREGRFRFEYIRRAIRDEIDFWKFKDYLTENYNNSIIIGKENGIILSSVKIVKQLKKKGIL